jgi:hypothetical protein
MNKWILPTFLLLLISCQTVKIKGEKYETSKSTAELGAIGYSKDFALDKEFSSRTYPKLENKIRLDVQVIPFDGKSHKFYTAKAKYNQSQTKIQYTDSIAVKPEFVMIRILDNNAYNIFQCMEIIGQMKQLVI